MIARRLLCLMLLLLLAGSLFAQSSPLDKGSYKLGGGLQLYYSEGEYSKTTAINLYPTINYFIMDNLLIGGRVNFEYSKNKYSYQWDYEYDNNNIGVGITSTYYFQMQNFHPFVGATAYLNKYKGNSDVYSSYTVEAGALFFFSKSAGFEPYLSFNWYNGSTPTVRRVELGFRFSYFIIN